MSDPRVTLFFDVGDTLIRPRAPLSTLYTKVINESSRAAIDEMDLKEAMGKALEGMTKIVDGHFRYGDGWFRHFIHIILNAVDCPEPWEDIENNLFKLFETASTFDIFPDVEPCFRKVRELGLKTAVVSNWGFRLALLLDRLHLKDGFMAVISSADVRIEKPDPAIFHLALDKTNSEPHFTVHIGDSPENDIEGAKAAGLSYVLVDRKDSYPDEPCRIRSLEELIPHLQARNLLP